MSIEKTLKTEPKSVRDHFERLANINLGNDETAGLQETLNEARERHQVAREAADRLVAIIDRQLEAVRVKTQEIEHLRSKRPEILAAAILGDGDFSEDDDITADIQRFEMEVERAALTIPILENRLIAAQKSQDRAGHSVVDAEVKLSEHRDQLRLSEARLRASA